MLCPFPWLRRSSAAPVFLLFVVVVVVDILLITGVSAGKNNAKYNFKPDADDFYTRLGLGSRRGGGTSKVTTKDVKKAFRQYSRSEHPDHKDNDEKETAKERFAQVLEAYNVLSDDNKRRDYDLGSDGMRRGGGGGGGFTFHFGRGGGFQWGPNQHQQQRQQQQQQQQKPITSQETQTLTDYTEYQRIMEGSPPGHTTFIQFYHDRCYMCRVFAPIWDAVASSTTYGKDMAEFVRIDIIGSLGAKLIAQGVVEINSVSNDFPKIMAVLNGKAWEMPDHEDFLAAAANPQHMTRLFASYVELFTHTFTQLEGGEVSERSTVVDIWKLLHSPYPLSSSLVPILVLPTSVSREIVLAVQFKFRSELTVAHAPTDAIVELLRQCKSSSPLMWDSNGRPKPGYQYALLVNSSSSSRNQHREADQCRGVIPVVAKSFSKSSLVQSILSALPTRRIHFKHQSPHSSLGHRVNLYTIATRCGGGKKKKKNHGDGTIEGSSTGCVVIFNVDCGRIEGDQAPWWIPKTSAEKESLSRVHVCKEDTGDMMANASWWGKSASRSDDVRQRNIMFVKEETAMHEYGSITACMIGVPKSHTLSSEMRDQLFKVQASLFVRGRISANGDCMSLEWKDLFLAEGQKLTWMNLRSYIPWTQRYSWIAKSLINAIPFSSLFSIALMWWVRKKMCGNNDSTAQFPGSGRTTNEGNGSTTSSGATDVNRSTETKFPVFRESDDLPVPSPPGWLLLVYLPRKLDANKNDSQKMDDEFDTESLISPLCLRDPKLLVRTVPFQSLSGGDMMEHDDAMKNRLSAWSRWAVENFGHNQSSSSKAVKKNKPGDADDEGNEGIPCGGMIVAVHRKKRLAMSFSPTGPNDNESTTSRCVLHLGEACRRDVDEWIARLLDGCLSPTVPLPSDE